MVLKDNSAALLKAKFVQSRRMDVRLGEGGLNRECWSRGRVEESRVSYWCWPSWPQDLDSGVENSGCNYGRERGGVGYTGAGEGGDNHVMV